MYISRLPYHADACRLFTPFAEQPYAIFLDSCGRGRFDVIAANPTQTLTVDDIHSDIFHSVKQQLMSKPAPDYSAIPDELPFTIGAMGYFSYDLGFDLAQLTPRSSSDICLPRAVVGFYDWSIVIDHRECITYLISRHDPDHPEIAAIRNGIIRPALTPEGYFSLTENFSPNMHKRQYAAAFSQVKQHIRNGDCYQINLAQRYTAKFTGSPWVAYQRLRAENPVPMGAYIALKDGAVLCLSPERFLQVKNGQVLTQPIKGTSPRFADPVQDQQSMQTLLSSSKDRAENIMIVDLLRNDLGKCCRPGSIQVPKLCSLESFASVHHLVSTITAILEDDQHPLDLLRHCFPGGSITGAPKRRAMEIIDQLEPHRRSLYCGSIAFCDVRGRMDSNIIIRTLLCDGHKIHCYGGGGLVNDSTMESEHAEIQSKISRLLKLINKIPAT